MTRTTIYCRTITLFLFLWLGLSSSAFALLSGKYKLPASLDATVSSEMVTELWAKVYRPDSAGLYPLIVFLHGNHGTCGRFVPSIGVRVDDRSDYTFSGTCPSGYVVTPNHRGYDYLGKMLVDEGYVVVSINANRGVNAAPGVSGDTGLNLRRGRLVLRHLQKLAEWNSGAAAPGSLGFPLEGLLDFSHVGLMGHSRGGEGMRAAVAQYRDIGSPWPARIGPVTFEALFEIGPVDGQTSRILNARDLAWNVLLPGCDGDVSNLQGVRPFDRMLLSTADSTSLYKSTFEVHGANHNFYNTQWQLSDSSGCQGQTPIFPQYQGSVNQRKTAKKTVINFFRAHLGPAKRKWLAKRFDPSYLLPTSLTAVTTYARGFTASTLPIKNFIIDNFNKATGISSRNVANDSTGLTQYVHGNAGTSHDATQRAANIGWNSTGGFLQINSSDAGFGDDVSAFRTLEFRVALRCSGSLCSSSADPTGDLDFSIRLVDSSGNLSSPVILKDVAVVRRPVGASSRSLNNVLQTVRIPLSSFTSSDLTNFRGVRFTFDQMPNRSIYLANVRLAKKRAGPGGVSALAQAGVSGAAPQLVKEADVNHISSIQQEWTRSGNPVVEIEVSSSRAFPIGGALPVLKIGDSSFTLSRFGGPTAETLIFTLDAEAYQTLNDGDQITVDVGGATQWAFGALSKP